MRSTCAWFPERVSGRSVLFFVAFGKPLLARLSLGSLALVFHSPSCVSSHSNSILHSGFIHTLSDNLNLGAPSTTPALAGSDSFYAQTLETGLEKR